jgi:hypothetical protein
MSVEKLAAQSLDKDSKDKDEDERRMMTPWRSRIVAGLEALPLLLRSPCLIKLLRQGLYDGGRIRRSGGQKFTFISRQRLAGGSVRPTRGLPSAVRLESREPAPEGGFIVEAISARLKVCPDTNPTAP